MHGTVCIGDAVNWEHPLNQGLVFWWLTLPDQQRGNVFRDLCSRHHGTLTNGPAWQGAVGRPGGFGSVFLDGSNDYIDTADHASLEGLSEMTIAVWLCKKGDGGGAAGRIISKGVLTIYDCFTSTLGAISFATGATLASPSASVIVGNWHRVVFVYSVSRNVKEIWVDGVLKANTTSSGSALGTGVLPCRIGGLADRDTRGWNGNLDDIRFHNRAWSEAEIAWDLQQSHQGYPGTLNWTPAKRGYEINTGGAVTAFPWHYYQQMMAG